MNKRKRLISLLLAVVMILGMVPLTALAEEDTVSACEFCNGENGNHSVSCITHCTCETKPAEGEAHAIGCPLNLTPVTTALEDETTQAPSTESSETPTAESSEPPTTESTEAPTAESTESPTTESTEAPTTESTEEKAAGCSECGAAEGHTEQCSQYKKAVRTIGEQLLAAQSVEDMYLQVLELMQKDPEALMALSGDEIASLRDRINELDPEGDDTDTQDLLDTLAILPNGGEELTGDPGILAENTTINEMTINQDTDWSIAGDAICTITGTVTIKSGATLTISGNGHALKIQRSDNFGGYLFNVEKGGSLVIRGTSDNDVIIDGAGRNEVRSLIICNNSLELEHVTLQNNYALISEQNQSGGGVYITSATTTDSRVNITNCKILNCKAEEGSAIMLSGAGKATVNVYRTIIDGCTAVDYNSNSTYGNTFGGAVRANGNGQYKLTFEQSVLRNCTGYALGGGIYWCPNHDDSFLIVRDCHIIGNKSTSQGGGMFLEGKNMTITASTGTRTEALVTGDIPSSGITGTLIQDNSSGNGGGVAFKCYSSGDGKGERMYSDIIFEENVVFNNNHAVNGAAIAYNLHATNNYGQGAKFEFFIRGAEFTNNVSTNSGGAIYVEKCREDYVVDVYFESGLVNNNQAKTGGAIAITSSSGLSTGGNFTMSGGTLSDNTASGNGGAVYVANGNYTMSAGLVENNSAQNGGSAYVTGGSYTLSGGEIQENVAAQNGGAAYITGGNFVMTGGEVSANRSANGAGVYLGSGDFTMSGGTIFENIASENGGAAYVAGGNVTIEHGTINGNKAAGTTKTTGNGGAIYMTSANATLRMESGTMNENEAANDGGAIYANGGTILIGLENCSTEKADEKCEHHTDLGSGRHHPIMNANKAGDTGGGIALTDGVVRFYCGQARDNLALYKGVGKNVFMDGGKFHLYDGADIGVARDPDLVIVGGELHNECVNKEYVKLYYYNSNTATTTDMAGLAEYEEIMNLPDGEYFWDAPEGYVFLGWTAKGAASGEADAEVRNKEQYVNSGEPVEILDALSDGTDQTAINTNRVFDGTTDDGEEGKIMHLYALWAPQTSKITYVDGLTGETISNTATDPDNPATYIFNRNSNVIDIQPVKHTGYDLVGWYIYQDAGQNANWNDTQADYENLKYEPNHTDKDYSTQKVYLALDSRNGVLELEAGNTNFGDITLVAKFEPAYTSLKITKNGCESVDENQTFIFKITGKPANPELKDIDMTVMIQGNGFALIKELPVGDYTVTEITDWSWRYTPDEETKEVQLVDSTKTEEVDFVNTRSEEKWLSGDCYAENAWSTNGSTITRS